MRARLLFLLVILVSLYGLSTGQQRSSSERQRFVGAWQAVSITDTRPDGTEVPDLYLGPHPTGLVIYDASGFMCAGSMNPERTKWADPSKAGREELAAAAEGYDSYCGIYDVDQTKKRIIHHVRVALDPIIIGADLARSYIFDGGTLKTERHRGIIAGIQVLDLHL
jgi:hypothetical protein